MTAPALALYWHFHQPCYRDPATGRATMPWVRLHGIKDYYGMAELLREFPGVRCSFNFVPALLDQLEACAAGEAFDEFEELARRPAGELSPAERERAVEVFFYAHWDRMIRVHGRYGELLEKRAPWKRSAAQAAPDFSTEELRDLATWSTLAWYHPLAVERDAGLRELAAKGRDFSESEKLYVLDRQRSVLAEVIPAYRELAARGQIELTTTPYYHPILPLLVDMTSARAAIPGVRMPEHWKPVPEDAREQLRRAVASHRRRFGSAPAGCWPSEGSLSEAVVPLLAEAGFSWTASDEEILAYSLGRSMERSELYKPYRLEFGGENVAAIFRDRELSDAIGFVYHRWEDQAAAARDFVRRARESGGQLVTAILDGENAWEYYPGGGLPFLRALYAELEGSDISTVLPGDYLAEHPGERLAKLWPGSWINHDFYIWAGHRDDQRAWDYLFRVRADLERFAAEDTDRAALERAWEALYAAEGSDWFWWYGDDHDSALDGAFDELFRKHLAGVYRALSRPAPDFLAEPIGGGHGPLCATQPTGSLDVQVDGRADEAEWLAAGCYRTTAGAMDRSAAPLVGRLFFGAGAGELFLRADFTESRRAEIDDRLDLHLVFSAPREAELTVRGFAGDAPQVFLDGSPAGRLAWGHVLELAVPRAALDLGPGAECAFFAELRRGEEPLERVPDADLLRFSAPPE